MNLVTKQEALSKLYDIWKVELQTEDVLIEECEGRVLAENIYAGYSIPLNGTAEISGIAVRSADFINEDTGMLDIPDMSLWKCGIDYVRVEPGDDFPDEFDAVIDMMNVRLLPDDSGVKLMLSDAADLKAGTNVREKASTLMKGELILCAGRKLIYEEIALAAMSGRRKLRCIKKPRVAFIPFGRELISPGSELERGQTFDSNSPMMKVFLESMGAVPHMFPPVKDKGESACRALTEALEADDIVVYNGPLSECLDCSNESELKGNLICKNVAASPGSRIDIAVINGKPVIGLSRNPLAALYGMGWCVNSLVCSMLGLPYPVITKVTALLKEDIRVSPLMETCIKMNVYRVSFGYAAYPVHDDANIAEAMSANALFVTEIGRDFYPAGSLIDVEIRYEFNE